MGSPNYYVLQTEGVYSVIEELTGLVMESFADKREREAYQLAFKLNQGAAFNGESPSFFEKKT